MSSLTSSPLSAVYSMHIIHQTYESHALFIMFTVRHHHHHYYYYLYYYHYYHYYRSSSSAVD